jgi:glutamine synthetase
MILKPDLEASYIDPFSATPMLILFCDIVEPGVGELYAATRARPPSAPRPMSRTARRRHIYVGPGAEFFMFDDVRFEDGYNTPTSASTTSSCRPTPARQN